MNCTICEKPVTLSPSAAERAKKYGGKASDYTKLFPQHSQCVIDKRNAPIPYKRITNPMFENLELLRLRHMLMKKKGISAAMANEMNIDQLEQALELT